MGYYSNWEIGHMVDNRATQLTDAMEDALGKIWAYGIFHPYYREGLESAKWYDMARDMILLSAEFPKEIFWVSQEGEDGKLAVHFFRNGENIRTDNLTRQERLVDTAIDMFGVPK